MRISKTLFKNLIRCPNFPAIYDMYINRAAHNVKEIDGVEVKELLDDVNELKDVVFNEIDEKSMEIFECLFDETTGEDLTNVTSAQLEAYADTFVEVERLAIEQARRMFNEEIHASTNTFEQKCFSYDESDHTYYCYLDGYSETDDVINIFEVKATSSKKYDEMMLSIRKTKNFEGVKLPLFMKDERGIMKFVGDSYIGMEFNGKVITKEQIDEKVNVLLDLYSSTGKYIYDIAIERHIVENSIKENTKPINYHLIVLNAEYIYDGTLDEEGHPIYGTSEMGQELFKIYDVTNLISRTTNKIIESKNKLEYELNNLKINYKCFSKSCEYKKTTQCKFFPVCAKKFIKDGSMFEYLNKHYAFKDPDTFESLSIYDLMNKKIDTIDKALPFINKIDNIMQYNCYINNETYIDKAMIKRALLSIKYPIYHLDFESYNCPLPRFRGEKPYSQSLFQYSLHIETAPGVCDINLNHKEYLAPDHKDHRLDLVLKMIEDIDLKNGGTVMVYNQNFEKTRLKELAIIYPKYKDALDKINDYVYDLYAVLRGQGDMYKNLLTKEELKEREDLPSFMYYHNNLHGSFSIKKVLPIFTNLTYKDLEVKNGTEAILTYGLLPTLTEKEYKEKYLALRIYCRQDTWAMVEILKGLRKMVNI